MPGRGVCRKHVSGCGLKPVPRTKNHKARLLRFGAWTNLWWKPQVSIYLGKYLPAPLKYFFFGGLERLNPHPAKVVDCWEAWSWLSLRHFKISRQRHLPFSRSVSKWKVHTISSIVYTLLPAKAFSSPPNIRIMKRVLTPSPGLRLPPSRRGRPINVPSITSAGGEVGGGGKPPPQKKKKKFKKIKKKFKKRVPSGRQCGHANQKSLKGIKPIKIGTTPAQSTPPYHYIPIPTEYAEAYTYIYIYVCIKIHVHTYKHT